MVEYYETYRNIRKTPQESGEILEIWRNIMELIGARNIRKTHQKPDELSGKLIRNQAKCHESVNYQKQVRNPAHSILTV